MKINLVNIYQFGKLVNQTYELSQDNLIIFSGNNESGKTHVRYFLTYMLVGLKKQELERFNNQPNHIFGGEMLVQCDDRVFTLYRTDKLNHQLKVQDEQKHDVPLEEFKQYIQQVDRELFDRIFHFDVLSIQKEQTDSPEHLGELLLSLSMSGTDAIERTEKKLKQALDQLFKKNGTNPSLNQQLKTLEAMEKQLKELKKTETGYHTLEQDIKESESTIEHWHVDSDEVKKQLTFYQTYHQLYHKIELYQLADRYLKEHKKPEIKRESNKADVITWADRARDIAQQLSYQQQQIEHKKEQIKASQVRLGETSLYEFLSTIHEQESFWRKQDQTGLQVKGELEQIAIKIQNEKRNIGLVLDDEEILQLALPKENVEELEVLVSSYKSLDDSKSSNQAELQLLLSEGDGLSFERHQVEEALLNDYERRDIEVAIELLRDTNKRSMTSKSLLPGFSVASGLLIISFIILYSINNLQPPIIIGLVLVYMIGLFGLVHLKQQSIKLNKKKLTLEEENQLQHYYHVLTEDETAKEKREELTRDWMIFTRDVAVKEKEINKQKDKQKQLAGKINRFKDQYPFLSYVAEPGYSKVLASVYQLKGLLEERVTLLSRLQSIEDKLQQFKQSIVDYCDTPEQISIEEMLKVVREQFNELTHNRERHVELTQELHRLEDEEQQLDAALLPLTETLADVYQAYQVDDFESFISQHEAATHYKDMTQQKSEMKQKLAIYFSPTELTRTLSEPLINERLLKEYLDDYHNKRQQLDDEHMTAMEQLVTLKAKKQQMESSTGYRDLSYQFQMKREAFNRTAKEWLIYKISYEQLLKTKRLFQTSMLPGILAKASEVFRVVTNNRYQSIDYDQDSKQLFVTHRQGTWFLYDLSQGTLDQVVIAIRLGTAIVLNQSIHLPFIIDDSFVHFDQQRKKCLLNYLNQQDRQSFYFTTTPKEYLTDYQVIDLEDN
ncbi:Uncharacterized protein YhaN [Halolactibacillus halophilus]|uniref:Uncharacterized protein YhaN n=1 Tax=Halolactibacillus halophilus TaxID=306540 RepID=A0A1I5PKL8_9BACI|nr:AAA family ATPase [Halolactibacillus halophilus]GEM02543.1 hypothetical protein HHA03_20750 [Halolactibacillus halophilus]SFP34563.1 Uncharacterized protein YhaN [Halolactibacillus halophilus]